MARPKGAENKDKPFRDALRMELAALGDDAKGYRLLARNLIRLAQQDEKDALQAIREIADRTDGKPAQAVIGGDEGDAAIKVEFGWVKKSSE